jgi:hypothetical protein
MERPRFYYTFSSTRSREKEEETTKTPTLEEVGGKGKSRFKIRKSLKVYVHVLSNIIRRAFAFLLPVSL